MIGSFDHLYNLNNYTFYSKIKKVYFLSTNLEILPCQPSDILLPWRPSLQEVRACVIQGTRVDLRSQGHTGLSGEKPRLESPVRRENSGNPAIQINENTIYRYNPLICQKVTKVENVGLILPGAWGT